MDPAAPGSAAVAVPVLLPPHRQDRDLQLDAELSADAPP